MGWVLVLSHASCIVVISGEIEDVPVVLQGPFDHAERYTRLLLRLPGYVVLRCRSEKCGDSAVDVGADFGEGGGCIGFSMTGWYTVGHGGIGRQRCIAVHNLVFRGWA